MIKKTMILILGVAIGVIAILMIVGVLPLNSPDQMLNDDTGNQSEQPQNNEPQEIIEYENVEYGLQAGVPDSWRIVENRDVATGPVVSFYNPYQETEFDLPLSPHSEAFVSHVSVFPEGYASELPSGDRVAFVDFDVDLDLNFDLNEQESLVYMLDDNSIWGYFIKPLESETPESWDEFGFIFVQARVDNFSARCFDDQTGTELTMTECDPLTGDVFRRYGNVYEDDFLRVQSILESIEFISAEQVGEPIGDLIQIDQPLPSGDVASPLSISGEARGYWYFEGSFPVILEDYQGNVLAQTSAEADGSWMTEGFVPFNAEITFESPGDERGYLEFQRSNPSGLPENERSFRLPVIFQQ